MDTTGLELCAAGCGVLYLLLAFRERPSCWIFYFLSALMYIPVLIAADTPGYAAMQLFFIGAAVYGLLRWNTTRGDVRAVHRGSVSLHLVTVVLCSAASALLAYLLREGDSLAAASADACLSVFSLAATLLTIWKVYENWHYWMIINALGVVLYLERGFAMTAVLFAANFVLSIEGMRNWRARLTAERRFANVPQDGRNIRCRLTP